MTPTDGPALAPDLATVIADYLSDVVARASTRDEVRRLRRDLTHVISELGTMRVDAVRARNVQALVDDLRSAGISADRVHSTVDSLRSLYAYAIEREFVRASPLVGIAVPGTDSPTPTQAMLVLGEHVAAYVARTIVIAFVLVAVGLVLALV